MMVESQRKLLFAVPLLVMSNCFAFNHIVFILDIPASINLICVNSGEAQILWENVSIWSN